MSEPKHSLGPWIAVECCEGCPLPAGPPVGVQMEAEPWARIGSICSLTAQGNGRYEPEVTWANAHLIAAAPCLYGALTNLVNVVNELAFMGKITDTEAAEINTEGRNALDKAQGGADASR